MDAELVRAAGARDERDARAARFAREHAPLGERGLAVHRVMDLARPIVEVDAHGEIDRAALAGDVTVEPGRVALVDLAERERALQDRVRVGVLRREQQAGGVEIGRASCRERV